MKGTIDQIETIYSAVGGLWWRVLTFFAVLWAGYIFGVLAGSILWDAAQGLHTSYSREGWYIDAGSWIMDTFGHARDGFGSFRILFLGGAALAIFFTQANLCRASCVLFAEESWFWWFKESRVENYVSPDKVHAWAPLFPVLIVATLATAWVGWRSWRNDHPLESVEA